MRTGILCLLIAPLLSGPAHALSTDRNQPMDVEADRAQIDDARGVSVYRGNVLIVQGSLRLTADELTLHTRDGTIIKAIATGGPATYRQRPDGKDQDVVAEALKLEYFADQQRLILTDQASIRQAGDSFRSQRIDYDIGADVVKAGASSPKDRVRITIQPKTGSR
ncbi:MAG: lipopolysaccharide transport periplasmic protein LptA [Gammaproteobacteria bacterium]